MNNYYKDLWSNPKTEAGQFFNKVDFNSKGYQLQEHVFKQCLWSIKNLREWSAGDQDDISTVLELGVGTGRMTKIMLQELKDIKQYECLDIKIDRLKIRETLAPIKDIVNKTSLVVHDPVDITKINDWVTYEKEIDNYDLILGSEVFMHILPKDIESVVGRLTSLLAPNGVIINIDWFFNQEPSSWCYIHDYDKLYRINGLQPVITSNIETIKQKLFCYGK